MLITDFNISEVSFEKLPDDKDVVFVMNGKVFLFDNNFVINCIFKDKNSELAKYYTALLPLKAIAAYPLGMIFKNQKIANENAALRTIDVSINLEMKLYKIYKTGSIPSLKKHLSRIPDKIAGYSIQRQLMDQNNFILEDINSGKRIVFPHYEIARWYYMKSSSMTRQVLSANLEGLYKEAKYLDDINTHGSLILKYGANNNDAADIFRFAKDEFANLMFKNLSLDLSASKYVNKNSKKPFTTVNLTANFPVHGIVDFKVKGFNIDKNTIFIYQILEENSGYPFQRLEAYREVSAGSQKTKPIATITKNRAKPEPKANNNQPNTAFEEVQIKRDSLAILNELRRGLEDKMISHKPIAVNNDEDEQNAQKRTEEIGKSVALSFNDANLGGDLKTAKASLLDTEEQDNEHLERISSIIEYFKDMIFFIEKVCKEQDETIQVNITLSNEMLMPRKDKNDKSRKKWLKSTLTDNETARKYIFAHISIDGTNYCAIEIEKDSELENLSTLLLRWENNEVISDSVIHSIIVNFLDNNGAWLRNYTLFTPKNATLSHIKKYEEPYIKGWAKNLIRNLP